MMTMRRCSREGIKTPQYELVSSPTKCPPCPVTRHPLPAVPSPPNGLIESVDEAEEQAVYEPIPGDK